MRRCPWRLGYGSPPPLQGASHGRESLREFGTRRRRGPRCEQAVANLPEGHLHRSQDASSRLLRIFIGVFAVHTFDPRQQHSVFISPASSLGAAFAGHRDLQRPTIFPQPSRL